jgi:hypothetical protein
VKCPFCCIVTNNSTLLQQIDFETAADQVNSILELELDVFSEATTVVIPPGLRVSECFKDWVCVQNVLNGIRLCSLHRSQMRQAYFYCFCFPSSRLSGHEDGLVNTCLETAVGQRRYLVNMRSERRCRSPVKNQP